MTVKFGRAMGNGRGQRIVDTLRATVHRTYGYIVLLRNRLQLQLRAPVELFIRPIVANDFVVPNTLSFPVIFLSSANTPFRFAGYGSR